MCNEPKVNDGASFRELIDGLESLQALKPELDFLCEELMKAQIKHGDKIRGTFPEVDNNLNEEILEVVEIGLHLAQIINDPKVVNGQAEYLKGIYLELSHISVVSLRFMQRIRHRLDHALRTQGWIGDAEDWLDSFYGSGWSDHHVKER